MGKKNLDRTERTNTWRLWRLWRQIAILQENVQKESQHYLKALTATKIQLQIWHGSKLPEKWDSKYSCTYTAFPASGCKLWMFFSSLPVHIWCFLWRVDHLAHLWCNQHSITKINSGRKSRSDWLQLHKAQVAVVSYYSWKLLCQRIVLQIPPGTIKFALMDM